MRALSLQISPNHELTEEWIQNHTHIQCEEFDKRLFQLEAAHVVADNRWSLRPGLQSHSAPVVDPTKPAALLNLGVGGPVSGKNAIVIQELWKPSSPIRVGIDLH